MIKGNLEGKDELRLNGYEGRRRECMYNDDLH